MFKILSTCTGGGYRYCRTDPPHPNRNAKGLYPLHRVLMENKIGRLLLRSEHVHHKDEIKSNDNIKNLELKTNSEHARHHHPEGEKIAIKCKCGKTFYLKGYQIRLRSKRSKSLAIYCSRRCGSVRWA